MTTLAAVLAVTLGLSPLPATPAGLRAKSHPSACPDLAARVYKLTVVHLGMSPPRWFRWRS